VIVQGQAPSPGPTSTPSAPTPSPTPLPTQTPGSPTLAPTDPSSQKKPHWMNCTELIESGFPRHVHCSETDNYILWFAASLAIVYNLLFMALVVYLAFQRWGTYKIRGQVTLCMLFIVGLTQFIPEVGNLAWLIGLMERMPWETELSYSFFIHAAMFSSTVSLKASSLYEALRCSARCRRVKGMGVLSIISFIVAIADPVIVFLYFGIYNVQDIWRVYSVQSLVVVGLNAVLVAIVVYTAWQSGYLKTALKAPILEIVCLFMFCVLSALFSFLNNDVEVHIPLSFWSLFDSLSTVPAFVRMLMIAKFRRSEVHEVRLDGKPDFSRHTSGATGTVNSKAVA